MMPDQEEFYQDSWALLNVTFVYFYDVLWISLLKRVFCCFLGDLFIRGLLLAAKDLVAESWVMGMFLGRFAALISCFFEASYGPNAITKPGFV